MAVPALQTAPVLSTPDTHIFEDPTPPVDATNLPRLSDEQVALTYEIERTVKEIRQGRWRRIALQFPDQMLVDAPRVYEYLARGLRARPRISKGNGGLPEKQNGRSEEEDITEKMGYSSIKQDEDSEDKLFILADTSYGACCVDEVAAEHVDADVVVHYGRSCLSPPSRLPVIYVFTERPLDMNAVISTFKETYPDKEEKVILMADIPYSHHIPDLHALLQQAGYQNVHATEILHNPSSPLPNRTIPSAITGSEDPHALRAYQLFHISSPPTSLLLTLSSRVSAIHIFPTDSPTPNALLASTSATLRRRYALITSLTTTPIFGILINTLSVRNYLTALSHVQSLIASAGKKSYTFVVGKVNAAKVANFSEIGGWVVIGCWESSLIESKDFWRPIITPFELEMCLQGDETRVWTGEWDGDFQAVLECADKRKLEAKTEIQTTTEHEEANEHNGERTGDYDSEDDSAPPEFDLRTGKYVSHSRPMRSGTAKKDIQLQQDQSQRQPQGGDSTPPISSALTTRAKGDIAQIGGVVSPGAEYLRSKRTWQGLGSDFHDAAEEDGDGNANANGGAARMEEGRSGIARGYVVGEEGKTH
ncbi:putative diphthamide synthesis protein-domain-containing protein [Clohesyomyces aquaticus]|uniref:2-(3-amino-3-carboxypropyl)histidine synthase subunit 2 n=1 Tax=Clohesyomyces aquaticus TaxID=1231657 RepID=A0A1Y1Z1G7_9PLEO|nr:putative diphthamide synthesis protein-domain-containing protein [Clohesyomyces aquaticus]